MTETNHAMLQRIAKQYDVPMSLLDARAISAEPVQRVIIMDVSNAEHTEGPGTTD